MRDYKKLFLECGSKTYKSPHNETIDAHHLVNQSEGLAEDWYKDSAFYHIWVKSFSDSNGDGVGDIGGILNHLDYIQNDVGCDAIWLSPVFECGKMGCVPAVNMHGYDTVDYYNVNCLFGNEAQLAQLISEVHKRGMKIIFDYVPNHTSSCCKWFLDSQSHNDGKDDWYLWAPKDLKWSPMGWNCTWTKSDIRSYRKEKDIFYYGAFGGYMPDLNYRNAEVREELSNVVRYWFNRGFDGMRVDAVRYLYENPGRLNKRDVPETHEWFTKLQHDVVSEYAKLGHPKFMVGEAWVQGHRDRYCEYFGKKENLEFNMLFDFDFANLVKQAVFEKKDDVFKQIAYDASRSDLPKDARFAYMLCNHDNLSSRPATVYQDRRALRLATALNLLTPGTPFVYYGNEVALCDAPDLETKDLRMRYPFEWNLVAKEKKADDSILALYRDLLTVRREHPALRRGKATYFKGNKNGEYGYVLTHNGAQEEELRCVFNVETYEFGVYRKTTTGEEKVI